MNKELIARLRHIYADGDPITEEAADCIEQLSGYSEQLSQRAAELEEERDAALTEVALLKPNPLCDMGCMLSCKMEADYYEKEIATMKSSLREAKRKIAFLIKSGDWCDAEKTIAKIDKALGEEK